MRGLLGIVTAVALTAILVFAAIILYKKATGTCGCKDSAADTMGFNQKRAM